MRYRGIVLASLLSAQALAGEPILLPDFTPSTTSDFSLAYLLQQKVERVLAEAGHVVLTAEVVTPVVGDATDACADVETCPREPLALLPARMAVVVRVQRVGEKIHAEVSLYEQSSDDPVETRQFDIEPGREDVFAHGVGTLVADAVSVIGPSSADLLVQAATLVAKARSPEPPAPDPVDPPVTGPVTGPVTPPVTGPVTPPATETTLVDRLEGTGIEPRHLVGARKTLEGTDEDPRDWLYRTMPHGGRFTVEVRAGIGVGDVDRGANVWVSLDDAGDDQWVLEGPVSAVRIRGALYAGYAPSAWVDLGLVAGLQYGRKHLITGWTRASSGSSDSTTDDVDAVQFYLQPRARLYLVPHGPLKPYLFAGAELRMFDSFEIRDPENIDYPDPPGGATLGPLGGAGILVDPSPIVGFFVEGAYTRHLGVRAKVADNKGTQPVPKPADPVGSQQTIGIVGGVQFRI